MNPKGLFLVVAVAALAALGGVMMMGPGSGPPAGADASNAELVAHGRQVYAQACAECHGANLEGQPNWRQPLSDGTLPAPPHDESGHTWHHADALLFDYTKRGGAQVINQPGFKSGMPGFGGTLSDHDIWAVLAFIKSRWPEEIRARQERMNP